MRPGFPKRASLENESVLLRTVNLVRLFRDDSLSLRVNLSAWLWVCARDRLGLHASSQQGESCQPKQCDDIFSHCVSSMLFTIPPPRSRPSTLQALSWLPWLRRV